MTHYDFASVYPEEVRVSKMSKVTEEIMTYVLTSMANYGLISVPRSASREILNLILRIASACILVPFMFLDITDPSKSIGHYIGIIIVFLGAFAGSIIGASVGQTLIPVPILGAMVGSMIGSAIASFGYGLCLEMLNMEQSVAASHAHLEQVRRECAMMKAQIEQSRQQMRQIAGQYFYEYLTTFNQAFEMMDKAVVADNIDEFIQANNLIVQQCGGKVQFNDMDGFMDIMNNNLPIEF